MNIFENVACAHRFAPRTMSAFMVGLLRSAMRPPSWNASELSNQKLLTLHSIASFDLQLSVAPRPHGEPRLLFGR